MQDYNLLILGGSGSGKTTLLASMYEKLCVENERQSYSIKVDNDDDRIELVTAFQKIIDPVDEWPGGTIHDKEFKFACHSVHAAAPLFCFNLFDYPGGLLTQSIEHCNNEERLTGKKLINKSDVVMLLLDGIKLRFWMEGKRKKGFDIESDLRFVLPMISQVCRQKPVHFVISKWDVMEGVFTLEEVRNKLVNELTNFKNFIDTHGNYPIRLIPISAIGCRFAKLDKKTGFMEKNEHPRISPMYIEMLMAAAMIDKASSVMTEIERSFNEKSILKRIIAKIVAAFGRVLTRIGTIPVTESEFKKYGMSNSEIALFMVKRSGRFFQERASRILSEIEQGDKLKDENSKAIDLVCTKQAALLKELETSLPASVLKKRTEI